jgi:hypothetical protein
VQGIFVFASFILDPDYSRDDFERLRDFIHASEIDYFAITILTPFVGSDLYEADKERLSKEDCRKFDGFSLLLPSLLDKREFYREFLRTVGANVSHSKKMMEKRGMSEFKWTPFTVFLDNYRRIRRLQES